MKAAASRVSHFFYNSFQHNVLHKTETTRHRRQGRTNRTQQNQRPTGKERRELQIRREGQRLSKNYGQGDEDSTEKFGRGLEDIFSRQNYYKY